MQSGHDRSDRHVRLDRPGPARRLAGALRAENKSPGTVTTYADCVTRYLRWCAAGGHRLMRRACLNQWVAGMLDAGSAPGTALIRQQAVRRFATWLTEGGELATHPFPGMKAPHVEPPLVEPLTETELRALIATCAAPDNDPSTGDRLHHRRDEAIIRLMLETAIRSGELVDLSSTTSISSRGSSPSGAARAAAGGSSRSDPPPPRHCSPTSPNAKAIRSPTLPTSGSARHQAIRQRRALPMPATPRQESRRRGVPTPPAAAHRRAPVARRRRLRIRPDGHRRLDSHRHARALHPRPSLRTSRRRSTTARPGQPLNGPTWVPLRALQRDRPGPDRRQA